MRGASTQETAGMSPGMSGGRGFRARLRRLVESRRFEQFVMTLIIKP